MTNPATAENESNVFFMSCAPIADSDNHAAAAQSSPVRRELGLNALFISASSPRNRARSGLN